jgi:integrase
VGRLALEFLILTAARSGEVRGARWDEIDETAGIRTIPAGRMKAGVQHRVPLSGQTIAVLAQARTLSVNSSELVFPGLKPGQPMSDMTLLKLLREIEAGVTVHGFRSTFRDWVAEETDYPREVAEAALAHTLDNKVEAAYRRTDFFEKRRSLMGDWADFCSGAEHG